VRSLTKGLFGVLASEQSHDHAVGASDGQVRQVLVLHPLHGFVEPEARAYRSRPGRHRLLHGGVAVVCEGGVVEPAKDDSPGVDDEAGIPAGVADARADFAEPVAKAAERDVGAHTCAHAGSAVTETFDRESERAPVGLAGDIVVDVFETEAFEPRRGSWRQVSLVVVAVDDHRPIARQPAGALGFEALEWDVDRPREVLVVVLGLRQHFDELGAVVEQPLQFIAVDWPGHLIPPLSRFSEDGATDLRQLARSTNKLDEIPCLY
jgi:hypothetical protein